jgi:hypothetical protein
VIKQLSAVFVLVFLMAGESVNAFVCARTCSLASQKLVSEPKAKTHHGCHSESDSESYSETGAENQSKQVANKKPTPLTHCQMSLSTNCQMAFCEQNLLPFEISPMDLKEKLSLETGWVQSESIALFQPRLEDLLIQKYSKALFPSHVRLHLRLQRFLI